MSELLESQKLYRHLRLGLEQFFTGYWIEIGKAERGILVKQAFDAKKEFILHSDTLSEFFYCFSDTLDLFPATEEDVHFVNNYFSECPADLTLFNDSTLLYEQYRTSLLSAGFSEATQQCGHFYRANTDQTAFIVNLIDEGYGITVVYGFTLSSFMGDSECFLENGEDANRCKLRESVFLLPDEENLQAVEKINTFYNTYCSMEKDSLLAAAKEKQKAFLNRFALRLKPLGFKKDGAQWTKLLPSRYQITFHAQKSLFSDQYYFRFYVNPPEGSWVKLPPNQGMSGVGINGKDCFDWQLMSEAQIESLIEIAVNQHILPLCEKYS